MTNRKPSDSLDEWREYFQRSDFDIFGIIDHAIMVAAEDNPNEFKLRRDGIAELLFSSKASRCVGYDNLELPVAGDEEANHGLKTNVTVGVGSDVGTYSIRGAETLNNEVGKEGSVIDEIMRVKAILINKDAEPNSTLIESLKKLEPVPMTVDILKDTEIGKAVTALRKHSCDMVRKLAKTLYREWKELVDQWMKAPKKIADSERMPESGNLSAPVQPEAFPSPPHDLDIYAPETTGFELSRILDCLDSDGNPCNSEEFKHERNLPSSSRRRLEGTNEANHVVERYNKDQKMRRNEADVRPMKRTATEFDEPRRQPKHSREQMVAPIQRKPLVVAEQKRNLAEPKQDKLKGMDPEAKFESAKQKLQESYQKHENAKRKRMIQVLETIPPKQSKTQKPEVKRSVRR